MAYQPDAACMAAARAAAGDSLTEAEILDAFAELDRYKTFLETQGQPTGKAARLRRFAEEQGQRTKLAAALARKQTALNIIIRDKAMENIGNLMSAGLTPQQAMLAMLEGSTRGVKNARKSVAAERQAFEEIYMGGMLAEIQRSKPHLVSMMDDAALDENVLREMKELRKDGSPGITGDEDAQFLAKTFSKWAELMRQDLNRLGANIGKLDDWAGPQMHDPVKMLKVDAPTWAGRILPLLDLERTFPDGLSSREALDVLEDIYSTIVTGISPTVASSAERGIRVSPANMAKQLGKSRVLHFKDADAVLNYRDQFGYSNTFAGMLNHLRNGARVGANMTVFGPNPEVMFTSIAAELQRRISASKTLTGDEKVRLTRGLQTDAGSMRHALDIATGVNSIPVSMKWHEIGSSIRIFQSIAKLGGALISSITDPITSAAAAQFRGASFFGTFADQLSMTLSGRPKGEAAEISFLIGEGFDGYTGHIASAFGATDGIPGKMSKLQEVFFRLNGLTWWTDSGRSAAGRIISAEMGMRASTAFPALPDAYKHVLSLHGIDEAKWELIRKANLRQVNGTMYVTPDRIAEIELEEFADLASGRLAALGHNLPADQRVYQARRRAILEDARRDLVHDVARFFADETSFGMIETDARSRRTSTWGTRPGTLAGEAMRLIMQFKGWPIAFTQRMLGRDLYGRRPGSWSPDNPIFWSETMPHIGTLLAGLTMAGYAAMTAKDALKGYGARDPADPRTWMAALQQGGAWGIYGDFLFSSHNRFGGGLMETLAGPSLGTVGDLWNISADARDAALSGGEDTFSTAQAFSSLWANVPGANLFYVKPALDYLVLNSLRETLSPGYLRRNNKRREKEFGQQRFDPLGVGQTLAK
jgi:hypothetical protein